MDDRLRKLERQAATGDDEARQRLFVEQIRLGILKPVDPGWAVYKKQLAIDGARAIDALSRLRGNKRLTPEQRKTRRQRRSGRRKFKRR